MDNAQLDALMKSLTSQIEKEVNKVMQKEVAKVALETMQETIKEEVYAKYDPTMYVRKKENDGLLDPKNIDIRIMNKDTLYIRSIRKNWDSSFTNWHGQMENSDKDVASIIENGLGYTWQRSKIYGMQPYPRPFHKITADKLRNGLAVDALVAGLKANGIDAKKV